MIKFNVVLFYITRCSGTGRISITSELHCSNNECNSDCDCFADVEVAIESENPVG